MTKGMKGFVTGTTATTKIKRLDYGLRYNSMVEAGPVVGDEVTITIDLEIARPVAAWHGALTLEGVMLFFLATLLRQLGAGSRPRSNRRPERRCSSSSLRRRAARVVLRRTPSWRAS